MNLNVLTFYEQNKAFIDLLVERDHLAVFTMFLLYRHGRLPIQALKAHLGIPVEQVQQVVSNLAQKNLLDLDQEHVDISKGGEAALRTFGFPAMTRPPTIYRSVWPVVKVLGIGGGGCNAIDRMVRAGIRGVELIAVNTDVQRLVTSAAPARVQIGENTTGGLSSGGDPVRGRQAAEESRKELRELLSGADMVFMAAGMGGGTGTGACPIIAELAKESGVLTIAIVTRPFNFEGVRRQQMADDGINQLLERLDSVIVIPNEGLLSITGDIETVEDAFKMADDVLMSGVRAISEVIVSPGLINLDFADVKSIMKDAGPAALSIGHGSGQDRSAKAAQSAVASPLLEMPIEGARSILYVVTGAADLTLSEVSGAAEVIRRAVDPTANVIFGVTLDPGMRRNVGITLVATGFTSTGAALSTHTDVDFRRLRSVWLR
jgi:cell division protein FtsZ